MPAKKQSIARETPEQATQPSKREVILQAATRVFLDCGYGAASMDGIAREAGVSKQTVYAHFGDKEALFGATIRDKCDQLLEPILAPQPDSNDPRNALTEIARRFLNLILVPENMAHFRAVVAESGRFPELAEAFYNAGPRLAAEYLAQYLSALDGKNILKVGEPERAARLFFAMLRGDLYMRHVLGIGQTPTERELATIVDEAVGVFLAGHAP